VRAGMKCAWVNRNGMRKPRKIPAPDVRVRSLSELLPLLVAFNEPQMPEMARR
jgi:hypothetical protein